MAITTASLLLSACSGDDSPDATPTVAPAATSGAPPVAEASSTVLATTAPPSATTTPAATPAPAGILDSLSLVYVDTRRGQGGDIFVAGADGSDPRLVLSEPSFRRPLDVAGGTLAILEQEGIGFVDLEDGEKPIGIIFPAETNILSAAFFDDNIFFYTRGSGCGPGLSGSLNRMDLTTSDSIEFVADSGLSIVGVDAGTSTVAVVPRGCDVGIAAIEVYDATTLTPRNSLAVEGCGWAIAALDQGKAVTSWQSCTPPDDHTDADATVYDFGIVGPTGNDVTVPDVDPNAATWIRRPGHAEVALGTTTSEGTGPGSDRGAGIFLLDLATRQFAPLVEGEGAEQFPVAWSPDGRYLLYGIVEAQGLCHFAYVDAEAADPQPVAINPDITFCGVNGHVVGWTSLP